MSLFDPRSYTFDLVLDELARDTIGHLELLSSGVVYALYHPFDYGLILLEYPPAALKIGFGVTDQHDVDPLLRHAFPTAALRL